MPDAEMLLYEELQTLQEQLWKKEESYLCLEQEWRDMSEKIKVIHKKSVQSMIGVEVERHV